MVRIRINSMACISLEEIPSEVLDQIKASFTYVNPDYAKCERMASRDRRLRYRLAKISQTIENYQITDTELQVPRGGIAKLREILSGAGLKRAIVDERVGGRAIPAYPHRPDASNPTGGELRWYQEEAIEAAIARENCLLRAPTGSGKTTTAIGLIARLKQKALVIVWNQGLLKQWTQRLSKELGVTAGTIGGGVFSVGNITVAMQQSLHAMVKRGKWPEPLRDIGVVVCDEVQRFAASTFLDVMNKFSARYIIGISADETRSDRKEFLIYDVFGAVAHEVTRDELIEDGAILDVECRMIPTEFEARWYLEQIERKVAPDHVRLMDEIACNKTRDQLAIDVICENLQAGEQVMVFVMRVEHARRLAKQLAGYAPTGLMIGGGKAEKAEFDASIEGLRDGSIRVVVGTIQAIGTGLDVPSLSCGVLMTTIGGNKQLYNQIRGRLSRPGTASATLYVLWDYRLGVGTLQRMIRWNRNSLVLDKGEWIAGRKYLKEIYGSENADE